MRIVDTQHHEPAVWLDWSDADKETRHKLFLELELAAMKAVGVDSVALNPGEHEWAHEAAVNMPDKFAVYPMINPATYDARERGMGEYMNELRRDPATVGVRISLSKPSPRWVRGRIPADATPETNPEPCPHDLTAGIALYDTGGYDELLNACERERLPVFVFAPTRSDKVGEMAQRYPNLALIVDHLGASQPPIADLDDPPFKSLLDLVELAQHPNVVLKFSSAPALASEPYPYNDIWDGVLRLIEAFGVDRLMWASDMSRFYGRLGIQARAPFGESDYRGKHNYAESLRFILDSERLDRNQKEWILGRSAQKWLSWPSADLFD